MTRFRRIVGQSFYCFPFFVIFYFLSYAPFLKLVSPDDPNDFRHLGYRSPAFYNAVEWCIVYSPADFVLLEWAELWSVGRSTEVQAFYFAQGATEPFEFNIIVR